MNSRYREQRDSDPDGLTAEERKFVDLYIITRDHVDAYFQSHRCTLKTAKQKGSWLVRQPHVAAVVGRAMYQISQEATKMAILAANGVLEEYTKLATADPRELVQVVVRSCRYCHGIGHKFQYTVSEQEERRAKWDKSRKKVLSLVTSKPAEFDEGGGTGYNPVRNPPHPDCPECFGEGHTEVKVIPTKGLSAAAARLYAGAKRTREGVEVKMLDPMAALDKIGQHHGLWKPDGSEGEESAEERARSIRDAMDAMDEVTSEEPAVAAG